MAAPWVPDNQVLFCGGCNREFTLIFRRHHCRLCGNIFCDDCTKRSAPIPYGKVSRPAGEMINMALVMSGQRTAVKLCTHCWRDTMAELAKLNPQPAPPAGPSGAYGAAPKQQGAPPANQVVYGQPQPQQQPQSAAQPASIAFGPQKGAGAVAMPLGPTPINAQPQPQQQVYLQPAPMVQMVPGMPPPVEPLQGPPPPPNPGPLPAWPAKTAVQRGDLFGMLSMGLSMAAAATTHRNDPHLSREDNAMGLANKVNNISGNAGQTSQNMDAIQILYQFHMPQGVLAGFVVTDPPGNGTLGAQFGFAPYDLIWGWESILCTVDTLPAQLAKDMQAAFLTKGYFAIMVYSFASRAYRTINVYMPPGKPNAILGLATLQIPPSTRIPGVITEPSDDIYVKAWKKHGSMYISAGNNAVPVFAPLTSENQELHAKVSRHRNGMWISTNEYHPIYDYVRLNEPLFVEAWRYRNGMLIRQGSEYVQLPMERVSVFNVPPPGMMPMNAQQAAYAQPPQAYAQAQPSYQPGYAQPQPGYPQQPQQGYAPSYQPQQPMMDPQAQAMYQQQQYQMGQPQMQPVQPQMQPMQQDPALYQPQPMSEQSYAPQPSYAPQEPAAAQEVTPMAPAQAEMQALTVQPSDEEMLRAIYANAQTPKFAPQPQEVHSEEAGAGAVVHEETPAFPSVVHTEP